MNTIDYYNAHAAAYSSDTAAVEFGAIQNRFLALLPEGAAILDFGCGSGRDAKYFVSRCYAVSATDGSSELCAIASKRAGIPVRCQLFDQLDDVEAYDGIWACASILHLPQAQLIDVLARLRSALKPGGVLYASFKYGSFEGLRDGRWFTDLTEDTLANLLAQVEGFTLVDQWISADVRPGRGSQQWLNCLILKR